MKNIEIQLSFPANASEWRPIMKVIHTLYSNKSLMSNLSLCLKSFLFAHALTITATIPLNPDVFDNKMLLYIQSAIELFGGYHFSTILAFLIGLVFFQYINTLKIPPKTSSYLLSTSLAFFLLLGTSYHEIGTWDYCFGNWINFITFLLSLSGYSLIFYHIIALFYHKVNTHSFTTKKSHPLTKHTFFKSFVILSLAYFPALLLCYPGNLCWDFIGQLEQVLANSYSTHHPLFITLWMGSFVKLGNFLFHSYEIGLYFYLISQAIVFITALSFTVVILTKKHLKFKYLVLLLTLYILSPIYWNLISTPIKDIPFVSFFIGYFICYCLALTTPGILKKKTFVFLFLVLQILTILSRNNGIYVILLSGIFSLFLVYKHSTKKELLQHIIIYFGTSFIIGKLLLSLLAFSLSATTGSIGEMLSIPFQQTARYVSEYGDDLSTSEVTAIETILGDITDLSNSYNPIISDPVKANFIKTSTSSDIITYLFAWGKGLLKHPDSYFEAFFAHVYGWFSPQVSNAVRYNAPSDIIEQNLLFPYANTFLRYFYTITSHFTPLSMLENIGLYVWGLFIITTYMIKYRQRKSLSLLFPLWISLLICMASPVFFSHPRYALPIITTLPFATLFILMNKFEQENTL